MTSLCWRTDGRVQPLIGPKILQQLGTQLSGIPAEVLALGEELISRRAGMIEFIRKNQSLLVNESNAHKWETMNAEFDKETETLRRLVTETAKAFECKILHGLDVAKIPWIDRDNMVKKIESLQKELSICKKGKPINSGGDQVKFDKTHDHNHKLQKTLEVLNKERSTRIVLKEMLAAAEGKMVAMRTRTHELERQLNSTRADMAAAQRQLDNLRQSHQHRHMPGYENSKRCKQVSRSCDVSIEDLPQHREAIESRVKEVQEEAAIRLQEAESREAQLKSQIESLKSKVYEEIQNKQSSEARVKELENDLRKQQEKYSALQERSRELVRLQHQTCLQYLPRKGQCSKEEVDIWNDLQATKGELDRVKEELKQSRSEKDALIQSLASMREGAENKMAEELMNREHTIWILQNDIAELNKDKIKLEQTLSSYENQLSALRFEVNLSRSFHSYKSDCEKTPNEDLEREMCYLYLQVASLKRERAGLASEAAARALLLERHERCAQMFAHVTRARHQLAAQIEGTTPPKHIIDNQEALSTLSKAFLSSSETWSALRAERARVVRLESTVLSQHQQLERESLLRVQHEQCRENLERELIRTRADNSKTCSKTKMAEVLYSNNKLSKSQADSNK